MSTLASSMPRESWPSLGKNRKERSLEAQLVKAGWERASLQHYAKIVKGKEVAIDEHIGHFCVGIYRNNRAIGQIDKCRRFAEAYEGALALEETVAAR